jgi:hypothetical protein
LEDSLENHGRLTFGDLVLSVLPWPYHKELPTQKYYSDDTTDGLDESLSIPIVTALTLQLLSEILDQLYGKESEDPDTRNQLIELDDLIRQAGNSSEDDPEHGRDNIPNEELVEELYQFAVQLRKSESKNPEETQNDSKKLSMSDLVLSTLPWPFYKELPVPETGEDQNINIPDDIPLDLLFKWLPYLITYLPIPGFKGKSNQDDNSDDD